MGAKLGDGLFRIPRKAGERAGEPMRSLHSLGKHNVIDRKRKERIGLAGEVGDARLDRRVHDGIAVELVRDGFVVALEQILVDAVVLIEQLQRGLKTFCEAIDRSAVKTLIIHTTHFEDKADITALGEKDVRADETEEVDLLAERAGLSVVFEDTVKPEHGHPFGRQLD